jgi:CheY-like chemotaxis protein
MNGYDACNNIKQFLKKNREICHKKYKDSSLSLIENIIHEQHQKPLFVACSAFIDDSIKHYAVKSGFDVILEAPLTAEKIKEHILSKFD